MNTDLLFEPGFWIVIVTAIAFIPFFLWVGDKATEYQTLAMGEGWKTPASVMNAKEDGTSAGVVFFGSGAWLYFPSGFGEFGSSPVKRQINSVLGAGLFVLSL